MAIITTIGGIGGFSLFLKNLSTLDKVFIRTNTEGKKVFSVESLNGYLKAPFMMGTPQFQTIWGAVPNINIKDRLNVLQLNWVAMTGAGLLTGYIISNII